MNGGSCSVLVVADAGPTIGYGHIGRCLALSDAAGEAAALGVTVRFLVADDTARAFVTGRGGRTLADGDPVPDIVLLDRRDPVTPDEVRAWQERGVAVVLMDDPGSARANADAVIDPPTLAEWPPAAGMRLGGFEHVLLRRDIRTARGHRSAAGPASGPVLVGMGGSDPYGLTEPVSAALMEAGHDVVIAVGPGYHRPLPTGVRRLPDPTAFAAALAGASIYVTAFGHSVLEATYLGTPSVCVVTRPDHRRDAIDLARHGLCVVVEPDMDAVVRAVATGPWPVPDVIDGDGAARVLRALAGLGC